MVGPFTELAPGVRVLSLANDHVEVKFWPEKGADILSFVHRRTGTDVLFKSPWGPRAPGLWGPSAGSQARWLEGYAGGWQVLLPNGGDECTEQGATWGFHGEAALAPWQVLEHSPQGPARATLEVQLFTAPLDVVRVLSLDGPVLRLQERVTNRSPVAVSAMWSHHPAFGAPFLDGGCTLRAGCRAVLADDRAPGTLLAPGSRHSWPLATTSSGQVVDLTQVPGPAQAREVMAYLCDFDQPYFAITNPRLGFGVGLRWPLDVFGQAWLWQEVGSSAGWPWFKRAYVVAVEPASTVPGQGTANARAKGAHLMELAPGASQEVLIEAVLFEGRRPVANVAEGGAVTFADEGG
jgi:hypothetical protein